MFLPLAKNEMDEFEDPYEKRTKPLPQGRGF